MYIMNCQLSGEAAEGMGVRGLRCRAGGTPDSSKSALHGVSISVRQKAGFSVVGENQTVGFTDSALI